MINAEKHKIELLAPAGNLEKMKTALAFGADAVYAGIPDFSLRVRINDFDIEKIAEAAKYCHERGKKIYITINIFAHNRHLQKLSAYVKKLKKLNVDALIVSDPGVIAIVKDLWPECELHLSTQANCTNWQSAEFWLEQGIRRVILGREVTLAEIKEIHKKLPELELEYFVHGAMCMAYSGRCFLSKYYLDKSANLGDCAQPCRWSFKESGVMNNELGIRAENHDGILEIVEEEHGSYILNSKDLCLIKYLRELAAAGITSFKIEGRAKSVYYQAMVAGIYSQAISDMQGVAKKSLDYLYNELDAKLMHRGYTSGFLFGEKADQNLKCSHETNEWEFCGQILGSESSLPLGRKSESGWENFDMSRKILVRVHNSIKTGDEIEIVMPKYDIIKMKVEKLWDAKTGEEITEAHGGQGRVVFLGVDEGAPEFSVVRRNVR